MISWHNSPAICFQLSLGFSTDVPSNSKALILHKMNDEHSSIVKKKKKKTKRREIYEYIFTGKEWENDKPLNVAERSAAIAASSTIVLFPPFF